MRTYGNKPYQVAVLHGGPGAPGYMAPVARELSKQVGVIEPLQSRDSLDGQIDELRDQLETHAELPATLVGSSWGAVLALIFAARYSETVDRLVLVGCAVFDAYHSELINPLRKSRVSEELRQQVDALESLKEGASSEERDRIFRQSVGLLLDGDVYDPLTRDLEVIDVQTTVNRKAWADFLRLRDEPGRLQKEFSTIEVPVTVIHGDYDPHLIEGIQPYLSEWLPQSIFHFLPKCGHYPWIERHARDKFYEILRAEISV